MVDNDSGGSNLVLRDRGIVAPDPNGGGTDLIIVSSTTASARVLAARCAGVRGGGGCAGERSCGMILVTTAVGFE